MDSKFRVFGLVDRFCIYKRLSINSG